MLVSVKRTFRVVVYFQRYGKSINAQNIDQQFPDQLRNLKEINMVTQHFRVTTSRLDYKILGQFSFGINTDAEFRGK